MKNANWRLITTQKFIAFSAGMVLFVIVLLANDDGFVIIIDHANLAFHEAGHIFFGILGSTMGLYGGTLGQLVFPVIAAVTFWRQGSILAYALALVWGCENLINIARYVADARARELPLVGGGDHDWANILSRWGLLSADTTLAALLTTLAWIGILAIWLWVGMKWYRRDA